MKTPTAAEIDNTVYHFLSDNPDITRRLAGITNGDRPTFEQFYTVHGDLVAAVKYAVSDFTAPVL